MRNRNGLGISAASTFYEGHTFPAAYEGALFFADAVRGCIYVMYPGRTVAPIP